MDYLPPQNIEVEQAVLGAMLLDSEAVLIAKDMLTMSELRESGSLEQDADMVWLLYREGYYKDDDNDRTTELIVAKQRFGPTGKIKLVGMRRASHLGRLKKSKYKLGY